MRSDKVVRALTRVPYPVLECVLNILKDEQKWIKGGEAKGLKWDNYQGKKIRGWVDPDDPNATQFCLIGAIKKCDPEYYEYIPESGEWEHYDPFGNITSFNDADETTHEKIVQVIKKAMEKKLNEKG